MENICFVKTDKFISGPGREGGYESGPQQIGKQRGQQAAMMLSTAVHGYMLDMVWVMEREIHQSAMRFHLAGLQGILTVESVSLKHGHWKNCVERCLGEN